MACRNSAASSEKDIDPHFERNVVESRNLYIFARYFSKPYKNTINMDKNSYALGMSIAHNMMSSGIKSVEFDDFVFLKWNMAVRFK